MDWRALFLVVLLSVACTWFSFENFSHAFPTLTLRITATRANAIETSQRFLGQQRELVRVASKAADNPILSTEPDFAASFTSHAQFLTFLSLHCEETVLTDLIARGAEHFLYHLYASREVASAVPLTSNDTHLHPRICAWCCIGIIGRCARTGLTRSPRCKFL